MTVPSALRVLRIICPASVWVTSVTVAVPSLRRPGGLWWRSLALRTGLAAGVPFFGGISPRSERPGSSYSRSFSWQHPCPIERTFQGCHNSLGFMLLRPESAIAGCPGGSSLCGWTPTECAAFTQQPMVRRSACDQKRFAGSSGSLRIPGWPCRSSIPCGLRGLERWAIGT